jgi:hypothetical protein
VAKEEEEKVEEEGDQPSSAPSRACASVSSPHRLGGLGGAVPGSSSSPTT